MNGIGLALVIGILGIFVLIGLLMIRSERKDREGKLQINRSLGFAPIDPDSEVVRKISHLYRNIRLNRETSEGIEFELRNVFHKRMAEGEMYTFDLVDTSGEEDSHIEKQAVAVVSSQLNLPQFVIFPKMDIDGKAAEIANTIFGWLISKMGSPVGFPENPVFEQRYMVRSPDPDETRQFLDDVKLSLLEKTSLVGINAGGDLFTISRIDLTDPPLTHETLSERVRQAMDAFSIFVS